MHFPVLKTIDFVMIIMGKNVGHNHEGRLALDIYLCMQARSKVLLIIISLRKSTVDYQ